VDAAVSQTDPLPVFGGQLGMAPPLPMSKALNDWLLKLIQEKQEIL
jgi:hypothetical protein